ncbi:hypothetical protein D4R51_02110 [bacterium]|nr:MAG: hypothetical protein D4R51_02110 [bacterium]
MKNFDKIYDQYYKKFGITADILPEFLAVKFGLKKALSFTIASRKEFDKHYPLIKNICAKSKLWIDYVASKKNRHDFNILISKRKLNIINDDKDQNESNRFSYPSCCIKSFNIRTHSYYFTNNIKKLLIDQDTFDFRLNPFLINSPFHLYSHLPCSLHCEETLTYATKLLNITKRYNKTLYSHIVYFNKTFGLYLDICGMCLLFKGKLADGQINYKDFYPRKLYENRVRQSKRDSIESSNLFREICQALSEGNKFTLRDNKLIIKKNRKIVQIFEKPGRLYWKIIKFI